MNDKINTTYWGTEETQIANGLARSNKSIEQAIRENGTIDTSFCISVKNKNDVMNMPLYNHYSDRNTTQATFLTTPKDDYNYYLGLVYCLGFSAGNDVYNVDVKARNYAPNLTDNRALYPITSYDLTKIEFEIYDVVLSNNISQAQKHCYDMATYLSNKGNYNWIPEIQYRVKYNGSNMLYIRPFIFATMTDTVSGQEYIKGWCDMYTNYGLIRPYSAWNGDRMNYDNWTPFTSNESVSDWFDYSTTTKPANTTLFGNVSKDKVFDFFAYLFGGYTINAFGELYLNKVADNGVSEEEVAHGSDIEDLPNYGKTDIVIDVSAFIDDNNYVDKIEIDNPHVNTIPQFTTFYAMDNGVLPILRSAVFPIDEEELDKLKLGAGAYSSNPIDVIRSLRIYPFDVKEEFNLSENEFIGLGSYPTNARGYRLNWQAFNKGSLNMGSFKVPKLHEVDFLNTDKYCKVIVYLPYIGTTEIPYRQCLETEVKVIYTVDFNTGSVEAKIYSDDMLIKNGLMGTIGFEVNVTGQNASAISSLMRSAYTQERNAQLNFERSLINSGVAIAGSLATGNAVAGAMGIASATQNILTAGKQESYAKEDANYTRQMATTVAPITSGSATCLTAFSNPQYIIVWFITNEFKRPEGYQHRSGDMVYTTAKLKDLAGWCELSNVDLSNVSHGFTASEMAELKSIINSGIYIHKNY